MQQRALCITIGITLSLVFIIAPSHETITHLHTVNLDSQPVVPEAEYLLTHINQPNRIVGPLLDNHPHLIFHDGRIRSYYLYVPENYEPGTPTALVIALHAGGSFALHMSQKTNLSDQADEHRSIIVYPNGITRCNPFWRMWNGGYCCGVAYERNVDDVGYIRALIDHLHRRYDIDPTRIYVTGHSNGAILAYRLAAELSDIIAAVAPVAGSIGGTASEDSLLYVIPEPKQPVSVIAFHGMLDENVPYGGGQANNSWGSGTDLSVNESITFWVHHNNCTRSPETTISESGNIIVDRYSGGDNGTEVILYTLVNGGHGWPGSPRGDRPSQEISATDIMWDFFVDQPKR